MVLADSKVSAKAILKKLGVLAREGGRKDGEWLLTELGLATLEKLKK